MTYLGVLWPYNQDQTWIPVAAPIIGCAASDRSFNLSEPQFPHLQNGDFYLAGCCED